MNKKDFIDPYFPKTLSKDKPIFTLKQSPFFKTEEKNVFK